MTQHDDTRWELEDPVLPAAHTDRILALARARFVAGAHGVARAPGRRERVGDVLTAAALALMVLGYLAWTRQTLVSLRPEGPSVLWEGASR